MVANKVHPAFGITFPDTGPSGLARFFGGDVDPGHTYDPAAELFGKKFYTEEVTEDLQARGFTGLDLSAEVEARVSRVMAVRREMNFLSYHEEIRNTPEMRTRYEIRTDERDGQQKLYHPEFQQYVDDMYVHYERYLSETGRASEFNHAEHRAFLSMERSLISGRAANILVPVDHASGVKYVNILSREGNEVIGKYVDISLENSGKNFHLAEAKGIIARMISRQGTWETNEETGFGYFSSRKDAVSVRTLRDTVEQHVLEKTLAAELETRIQPAHEIRPVYDGMGRVRNDGQGAYRQDSLYVPAPVVLPQPEGIAIPDAMMTESTSHPAGALIALEELARRIRDDMEPEPGPIWTVPESLKTVDSHVSIMEQSHADEGGAVRHETTGEGERKPALIVPLERLRAFVTAPLELDVPVYKVVVLSQLLSVLESRDTGIWQEHVSTIVPGEPPVVMAAQTAERHDLLRETEMPEHMQPKITGKVAEIPDGFPVEVLEFLAAPEPGKPETGNADAELSGLPEKAPEAETLFIADTVRYLAGVLSEPAISENLKDESKETVALWIVLFAAARFLSAQKPQDLQPHVPETRHPEKFPVSRNGLSEIVAMDGEAILEKPEKKTDTEHAVSFIFAFVLYLLLRKKHQETVAFGGVSAFEPKLPSENSATPEKDTHEEVGPFILLSIIWHLSLLREGGFQQGYRVKKTKKDPQKKPVKGNGVKVRSRSGMIYPGPVPYAAYG